MIFGFRSAEFPDLSFHLSSSSLPALLLSPKAMSSVKVEVVVKEHCKLGEAPLWEEKENSLLFVDITGKKVFRWNSLTKEVRSIPVGKSKLSKKPQNSTDFAFSHSIFFLFH